MNLYPSFLFTPFATPLRSLRIPIFLLILWTFPTLAYAQTYQIAGTIKAFETGEAIVGAQIQISGTNLKTRSFAKGRFSLGPLASGAYLLKVNHPEYQSITDSIVVIDRDLIIDIQLPPKTYNLAEVTIEQEDKTFGITRLKAVEGFGIYASKKNEVVVLKDVTANLAANNSRQAYGKVVGLNIWESDGAGVQLGIGGRGLSPNRSANFNTRQNGYDISADALGYPESYYTPPLEALERIEIIRGAASLQYGTQFGGLLNFRFKKGPSDKKMELTSRQTVGSFGFFSSFNSIGGSTQRSNYYAFYQYKQSDGWRPNSNLEQHTAHASFTHSLTPKLTLRPEYTFMYYLAQQPGGLTDVQFRDNPNQSLRARNWFKVNWNLFALNLDYTFSSQTKLNSRFFGLVGGRDALGNLGKITEIDFGQNRDFLSDDFQNMGNETRLIHRYNTFGNPSVALLGMRIYRGFTLRKQGEGNDGSGPDFVYLNPDQLEGSDFELPSTNVSIFAENVFNLSPKVSVTPGVRFEYIRTEAEGYYTNLVKDLAGNVLLNEQIPEQKENARSFVFAGIGMSYKPNDHLELYGNFSQNYRAINFNDIRVNVGSLVVDPNLKDERGFNADLGIRGNWENLFNVDVSIFHLSYQDRIGSILRREPNPQFNNLVDRVIRFRTNVADASIYGIESFAELNIFQLMGWENNQRRLSVFTNVALITANYENAQLSGIEGNEVEWVPRVNIKTGLTFLWGNFNLSYQYAYVGEHFSDATNAIATPTAIEGIIPAYQVMDLSLSYGFKWVKLETGVNNLLDESYFTRRATGYPGPGIIPAERRSVYATLEVKI